MLGPRPGFMNNAYRFLRDNYEGTILDPSMMGIVLVLNITRTSRLLLGLPSMANLDRTIWDVVFVEVV